MPIPARGVPDYPPMGNPERARELYPQHHEARKRGGHRARHAGGSGQIDEIARKHGMTSTQRKEFGKFVEDVKYEMGRGGADNLSWNDLDELAKEFLAEFGNRYR